MSWKEGGGISYENNNPASNLTEKIWPHSALKKNRNIKWQIAANKRRYNNRAQENLPGPQRMFNNNNYYSGELYNMLCGSHTLPLDLFIHVPLQIFFSSMQHRSHFGAIGIYRTHCFLYPTRYSFIPERSEAHADEVPCPRTQHRNNAQRWEARQMTFLWKSCTKRVSNSHDRHQLFQSPTQQTRGIHPMLFQCWPTVFDAGPTLKQHWVNAPCLLGTL